MMTLGLNEFANPFDEAHRLAKILEVEFALNAMRIIEHFPVGRFLEEPRLLRG